MIKVLVVDDEVLLCDLFDGMLTEMGYGIEVAMSADEALETLRKTQFDVVLLDLMLGPVSGFTVLEKIRQMYHSPRVLVMTGYGSPDVAIEAMKQGAADFIVKPVVSNLLDIRIRKVMDERRAQHLAITDGLTGLHNRRYFEERLDEETHRSRRYDRPVSIIMIDIDFFKQFNDTCGHLKGDDVLSKLSHILQDHTRETDITARYGGEEFVMILPETSLESSRMLGERIRKAVDDAVFEGEERVPAKKITVSVGVSCLTDDEGGYDTLDRADRALYKSKQAGKNLVTVLTKEGLSQE